MHLIQLFFYATCPRYSDDVQLSIRHHLLHGKPAYANVSPRILIEEFLDDGNGEATDYKFYCFNGQPQFFKIDKGRQAIREQGHYDLDGHSMPFHIRHYVPINDPVKLPPKFDERIDVAEKLSKKSSFC